MADFYSFIYFKFLKLCHSNRNNSKPFHSNQGFREIVFRNGKKTIKNGLNYFDIFFFSKLSLNFKNFSNFKNPTSYLNCAFICFRRHFCQMKQMKIVQNMSKRGNVRLSVSMSFRPEFESHLMLSEQKLQSSFFEASGSNLLFF